MKKYIYQKFLLFCNYQMIDLKEIQTCCDLEDVQELGREYSLFDVGVPLKRKIALSVLDKTIDTMEDWNRLAAKLADVDELVLYEDVSNSDNPIINEYRTATTQAYICHLKALNHPIKIYYNCFDKQSSEC